MSQEQARQFIDEAGTFIQTGKFKEALSSLERAIALDPTDSEAFNLQGVAYSNLQLTKEAEGSFERSVELSPQNAKAHYNFAVHLYGRAEKDRALDQARQAGRWDPNHEGAKTLISRIEREMGIPSPEAQPEPPPIAPPPVGQGPFAQPPTGARIEYGPQPYLRPGYYDYAQPVHSLAFVERIGKVWTGIGIALAVAGFLGMVWVLANLPHNIDQAMKSISEPGQIPDMGRFFQNGALILGLVLDGVHLAIIAWMIIDIIDRRASWVWIVPNVVACCCFGLNWLILALYIPWGRQSR